MHIYKLVNANPAGRGGGDARRERSNLHVSIFALLLPPRFSSLIVYVRAYLRVYIDPHVVNRSRGDDGASRKFDEDVDARWYCYC